MLMLPFSPPHTPALPPPPALPQVQAPMLMLLGAKDRRVPLQDGQQYTAALRARADAPEASVCVCVCGGGGG